MMLKLPSVLLVAVLTGRRVAVVNGAGCFPVYSSGTSYSAGQSVSATTTTTETTTDSQGVTTTTTTTGTHNYECVSGPASAFCSQSGFAPGGDHFDTAWIKETAECSGTADPPAAPTAWTGGGCPQPYEAGIAYNAGEVVFAASGDFDLVYQCAAEPTNLFCGMSGYSPVDGQFKDQAWTQLGSCTGTLAPTGSPIFDALADAGGCPQEYNDGTSYEEGDAVSADGLVYTCKPWPQAAHCSQVGYEPGTSAGSGASRVEYWREAWSVTGYCDGTISPTVSPSHDVLTDMGGCPEEWSAQTYEEGDKVSSNDLVFQCKAWPQSAHCGQAGYEPDTLATSAAWRDAWTIVGHCNGSIGPTASPSVDPNTVVGSCPEEWSAGDNTKYEEGDMVSVAVSTIPIRKVAYSCRAWPLSGFCGQFSPTEFGGDQGWALKGSCDGSVGPTTSPSFDALASSGRACPEDWSASKTDYAAGDQVSYAVSNTPERKIVFECKSWPNSGFCNQGAGYEPTTMHAGDAWTLIGACDGSFAPTLSPAAYAGTCTYDRCRLVSGTETCTEGTTGCTCTPTDVDPYSSSAAYVANDVVRLGAKQFRCRTWPNELWCPNTAYAPTGEAGGIWTDAWTSIEDCPP